MYRKISNTPSKSVATNEPIVADKTTNTLVDPKNVEKQILEYGLYPYLDWQLREFPKELYPYCGKGVGLWQYPNQFSKYMAFLKNLGRPIETYVEIGVAAGGTFMFTMDFLQVQKGYAVDIADIGKVNYIGGASPFDGKLAQYLQTHRDRCEFVQGDSHRFRLFMKERGISKIDLLLIDGDHSYEGVKRDYDILSEFADIIVFHDVVSVACPGVAQYWREKKTEASLASSQFETVEFIEQYPGVPGSFLGIGVMVRKTV